MPPGAPTSQPPRLNRRGLTLRLRLAVPSTAEAVRKTVSRVASSAARTGCLGPRRADFEIALHEALANAVFHGNRGESGRTVRVRAYGEKGRAVLVAVRDEGEGFLPEEIPDPTAPERRHLHHGRGLFLIRELTDGVAHRKGGRELVFWLVCTRSG